FHPHLFYKSSNPSTCTLTDPNNLLLPPPPLPKSQISTLISISFQQQTSETKITPEPVRTHIDRSPSIL
ncbi:hypothetical protein Goari_025910, partial [Gossypium aridum]|nr:hypothetical protein [Gossypium aridum]